MSLLGQDYCLTLSLAYKKTLTFQGLVMDVVGKNVLHPCSAPHHSGSGIIILSNISNFEGSGHLRCNTLLLGEWCLTF
jgi:hypothetical protein